MKLIPTPQDVREAREALQLTQPEAAALVHLGAGSRWSEIEAGITRMDPARWELFAIKTGMHPDYRGPKVGRT